MILIQKKREPKELEIARKNGIKYEEISKKCPNLRHIIYNQLLEEQKSLCAYCMSHIIDNANVSNQITIDHFIPRNGIYGNPKLGMQYNNMLGSCDTCQTHKGSKLLSVNPLKNDDITQIKYKTSGEIYSDNPEIQFALNDVLNLNEKKLVKQRKSVYLTFVTLYQNNLDARLYDIYDFLKIFSYSKVIPYYGIITYFLNQKIEKSTK